MKIRHGDGQTEHGPCLRVEQAGGGLAMSAAVKAIWEKYRLRA